MEVHLTVTLPGLTEAIQDAVNDVSLSGLGADGASEYEITGVSVEEKDGSFEVVVDVERIEGKFAAKDEIADMIRDSIDEITVAVES